jgi:addiction module HigA family antidote
MKQEYEAQRPQRPPIHPGEILKEDVLPALGLSVTAAACQLRISRQTLHRILRGTHAVTPEMAVRLGKFCGNGPGLWLRMQQDYDFWKAKEKLAELRHDGPVNDRKREDAWRRSNQDLLLGHFSGQWVVLEGEEIMAHDTDPAKAVADARAKGVVVPFVFYVEAPRKPGIVRIGL